MANVIHHRDCAKCGLHQVHDDELHCILRMKEGEPTDSSKVEPDEKDTCTWWADKDRKCRK